jgi:hypothetical protein
VATMADQHACSAHGADSSLIPFTPCAANRFSLPSPSSQADVTVAAQIAVPTATAARGRNSTSSPGTLHPSTPLSSCHFSSHPVLRTMPLETVAAPVAAASSSSKSNPFGDAKPITEEERERRFQAAKVTPHLQTACCAARACASRAPATHLLTRCLQAEREKLAAAAAPKERSPPAPRRDQAAPRKEGEGRREGGAFQSRRDGGG